MRGQHVAIEPNIGPSDGLSARSLRGPLTLAISCFLIWGLAYGLLDVLNKHFQETLDVSKAESSWLQIAYFGAYLLMSVPAGIMMQAKGYKFGLVTGLIVTAIGALLFVPSAQVESFPFFVGSMFVLATGLCVLETSADTYVSVLGKPENAPKRLNLAQSFNALGVFFGPIIGGSLFFNEGVTKALDGAQHAVQLTYLIISIAVLLFALVVSRAYLPEIHEPDHARKDLDVAPEKSLIHNRHFVLGILTQAFYIGSQVGVAAFFINLTTETWHGMTSQDAAYLLSVATLAYLVGRFFTTALLLRFTPQLILTIYGIANVLLCLVAAAGIEKISALALVGVFFFMGTMFPTIFTLGIRDLGRSTKRASSIMVMAIGGGAILPYPMGLIGDAYGMPTAFLLPAIGFALVALYGAMGARTQ
ncbi:MAG: sugar MFS transporter [Alphaproteobacteria bacterium]|nr:sugar MFS transporter [Alphaproteobacteria bacterium]MDE2164501.1 sugar MFS transporter [Alphaproteobacteria bacterium]MDE2264510.1 sugar MFS transporter [Alphaproteobacteria bacterium]